MHAGNWLVKYAFTILMLEKEGVLREMHARAYLE